MTSNSTKLSSLGPKHSINFNHTTQNTTKNAPIHIKLPPLRTPNPHTTTSNPINHCTPKKNNNSSSDILRLMDCLKLPVPSDIYTSLIKECTLKSDPSEALHLHSHLSNQTNFQLNSPLLHRLLLMHISCGQMDIALNLFDKMPRRKDFVSAAIIIVGCFNIERYELGLSVFVDMLVEGNVCDFMFRSPVWVIVVVSVINACVNSREMEFGRQLHGLLLKLGVTDEFLVYVSLMEFYGKFGCLESANSVFNKLHCHNTVTWTAKIVNSCRNGLFCEVIKDFEEMGNAGIERNSFTFSSVLRACARMDDGGNCGKQVHAFALKLGLYTNTFVQCGLVDMYGKCGLIRDAKLVFELINDKTNTACWNALLMAYVRSGLFIEAIKLMYEMEAAQIHVKESLINHVKIGCANELWEQN
ncbi:pentatricopeptide repeat-containing protein At1g31790 [Mercurialis annua]|uniref:pentatricopeptide repeat-containing protein At1g31790 n=1 Tax=Mercurialis annua TaxID=3986 RepID=UPI00215F81CA|nr:pentatricopeptide repeat-containing protein At1g31790 [Mercurialis annua]XP_050234626.1 pentatricopeptide repeat-containing protein At1g31790 [Mercurialis annua]XP_050234627.1 pentatricopeptide repeat-containing protein At1g31790 [Mercurialis annua]XP_050234628.1 pentatricopeptide repeat-containing protein At1g31790 [Mercurialis annua]